jgi:ethanolamine transporter EutH
LDAGSGDFGMKGCIRFARGPRKRWIFVVCDWLVNLIPVLLSLFVVMFCLILFGVWYFPGFSWWLVSVDIVLIVCMAAVTVTFAIGSREISVKMKPSGQYKNRGRSSLRRRFTCSGVQKMWLKK